MLATALEIHAQHALYAAQVLDVKTQDMAASPMHLFTRHKEVSQVQSCLGTHTYCQPEPIFSRCLNIKMQDTPPTCTCSFATRKSPRCSAGQMQMSCQSESYFEGIRH